MKKIFLLFTMALAAICCTKAPEVSVKPDEPDPPTEKKIPINITTDLWTKATDTGFETGDQTGIYVVNYVDQKPDVLKSTKNHVDNMKFTYNGTWTPATPIYWKDNSTHADFYCYYPYNASITDVKAVQHTVKTDQSTLENYKASDFFWGKTSDAAPTNDPVAIRVNHSMSYLKVILKAGKGFKAEELANAQVSIHHLKHTANIDLSTGKATATGAESILTPFKEDGYYKALVVPQSVSNTDLVQIKLGTDTYTLKQTISFQANKQHTCTITVDRRGEGVNVEIGGWETDENDYGGTVN